MEKYTDKDRVAIAWKQYDKNLSVGDPVAIDDQSKFIGTVEKIYDDDVTGMKIYFETRK